MPALELRSYQCKVNLRLHGTPLHIVIEIRGKPGIYDVESNKRTSETIAYTPQRFTTMPYEFS